MNATVFATIACIGMGLSGALFSGTAAARRADPAPILSDAGDYVFNTAEGGDYVPYAAPARVADGGDFVPYSQPARVAASGDWEPYTAPARVAEGGDFVPYAQPGRAG